MCRVYTLVSACVSNNHSLGNIALPKPKRGSMCKIGLCVDATPSIPAWCLVPSPFPTLIDINRSIYVFQERFHNA